MLRPFPPKNASRTDFKIFQSESDALLRSVSSLASSIPMPAPEPTEPYDDGNLGNLTNMSAELLAQIKDKATQLSAAVAQNAVPAFVSKNESKYADVKDQSKSADEDSDSGFILTMILKIVPIGVNIAAKGNTIAAGLKDTAMGIVNLLKNIALLTVETGIDTIEFGFQFAIYVFKLILCSVYIISNFPKCLTFYVIDILMFVVLVLIVSVLFVIDIFLMVKYITGTSCIEGFVMILRIIEMIDHAIYSVASFHIIHYPDKIINMCYSCSMMGDTTGFKSVASRLFTDIFISIPSDIGGPIGDIFSGIGEIFSFFNI